MKITDIRHSITVPVPLAELQRRAVLNALAYTDGEQKQAARLLKVSPRMLCHYMDQHGIPRARVGTNRR